MDPASPLLAEIALLGLLALFAVGGIQRGFVHEVLDIVGLVLATAVALLAYERVGAFVDRSVGLPPHLAGLIGFAGVFFAALAAFGVVAALVSWPIEKTLSGLGLHRLNSALGVVPALAKGVVIVGFALRVLALLPYDGGAVGDLTGSQVGRQIAVAAGVALPYVESAFDQITAQATRIAPPLGAAPTAPEKATPELNVPRGLAVWVDPDAEAVMLRLINQERALAGRPPLVADEALRAVARAHSEEMFRLGYFSHDSPVAGSPFDRLRRAGIRYAAAGENLAYAPSVESAHRGLMESPGHRRNILDPEFRKVGIGVQQSGLWGKMFTQNFTN